MLFLLQFPFADLRDLQDINFGKLPTPLWPIPEPDYNFIRSFGIIRERTQGGLTGWVGENMLCLANRAMRFQKIFPFVDKQNHKQYSIKIIFRRFYSDGNVLCKFELCIQLGNKDDTFSGQLLDEIVRYLLGLEVTIPNLFGEPKKCKVWHCGKYLGNLYANATTNTSQIRDNQLNTSIIKAGRPLIILVHNGEIKDIPFDGRVVQRTHNRKISISFHSYKYEGIYLPLWIINNEPYDEARKLRIYLSRLHCERECLKIVLSSIANNFIDINKSEKSDVLQHYLNSATRHVIRLQNKSLNIDERIGSIADEIMDFASPGEKQEIINALKNISVRLNILHKILDFLSDVDESNAQNFIYLSPEIDSISDISLRDNIYRAIGNLNVENVDLGLFDLARMLENEMKLYLDKLKGMGDTRITRNDLRKFVSMIDCVQREHLIPSGHDLHFLRETRNERVHGEIPDRLEREQLMRHASFLVDLYLKYIEFFNSQRNEIATANLDPSA